MRRPAVVRWVGSGKDAGSVHSGAMGATEDAARGRPTRHGAHLHFVKPSY
jgi:hypothetical protein